MKLNERSRRKEGVKNGRMEAGRTEETIGKKEEERKWRRKKGKANHEKR